MSASLSSQAVGGRIQEALPAAVAVELVHNAGLLHDDTIDGDQTRRHRLTVWTQFGTPTAILAGDALFFLATWVLTPNPAPLGTQGRAWLDETILQLIHGAHTDSSLDTITNLVEAAGGRDRNLKVIQRHTATALDELHKAHPDPRTAVQLAALLHLATHRDR